MENVKIAIVDDKKLTLLSLIERLSSSDRIEVLFTASNGKVFLEQLAESSALPDLVFMDIDMPIMNGIEAVDIAARTYPNIKFLMLSVFDDDDKIFEAIKAGAIGYLLKDEKTERLLEAMEEVLVYGGSPMSPVIARKSLKLLSGSNLALKEKEESPLTEREMDILERLVQGKEYKKIADEIFLSPHTVRTHITNIYKKLHVNNRVQAVNISSKKGWFGN